MNRVLAAGDLSLTDVDQHFGGDVGGGGAVLNRCTIANTLSMWKHSTL